MIQITCQFEGGGETVFSAAPGKNLLAVLRDGGIALDAPCGGAGTCGKCRVRVRKGSVVSASSVSLSDADYAEGWRLACQSRVTEDVTLLLPAAGDAYRSGMRTADFSNARELAIFKRLRDGLVAAGLPFSGSVRSLALAMDAPSLFDTMPDNERLCRAAAAALHIEAVALDSAVLPKLPRLLRENGFAVRCVIDLMGKPPRMIDALTPNGGERVCGLAVDIGTTSVTGVLVDADTGEILAKASAGNGQIRFGADVINRIVEQGKPGGLMRMQQAIVAETLLPMLTAMYASAHVRPENVYCACVAGNTTMEHLLLAVPAEPLRTEPYIPAFFALDPIPAARIGLPMHPAATVRLAPNIGSYVGGDVTAGALVTGMWNSPALTLFIDLGTNGEIVLGNNEFLMACACSAGPAFEGGDISCGMRATAGAIESVRIDYATLQPALTVIGETPPTGLCGSGIIDCIAELFKAGAIDAKGGFVRESDRIRADADGMRRYILAQADPAQNRREVSLNESDIDNFIRAKGAIFSGIQTLLATLTMTTGDIERVLVAGGIGSGVDMAKAVRIGMLPDIPLDRFSYIGNASLAGAYAMLMSAEAAETLTQLARGVTYIELSTEPSYMDAFVAACFLPHTDKRLFPSCEESEK